MNQTVFGTEMVLLTFILLIIQIVFLFIHLGALISKPFNKANWRFFKLLIFFALYNVCSGLFPDTRIAVFPILFQNILAYGSGIALASYYFYFLIKEIDISQRKLFNLKFLVISLTVSFFILYVLTYLFLEDFKIAKRLFIIFPSMISIYFCFNTIKEIIKKTSLDSSISKNPYKRLFIAGNLGIAFMATMPIVVLFGDFQALNVGLVNVSFFLIWFAYYSLLYVQAKNEIENIVNSEEDKERITELQLTPREFEVATLILKGKNYTELAEMMFISNKTVSKHASNIFKKAKCCNRDEFIDYYS